MRHVLGNGFFEQALLNQADLPAGPSTVAEGSGVSALDMEVLKEARASLKDKFTTMVGYFLEDSTDYMSKIDEAAVRGEISSMVSPAHTLKSSSKLMGAMQVSDLAKKLEEISRNVAEGGQNDVDVDDLVAALRQALSQASSSLKEVVQSQSASM